MSLQLPNYTFSEREGVIETIIDLLMIKEIWKKILDSSLFMVRSVIRSSLYLWYLVESGKQENFP